MSQEPERLTVGTVRRWSAEDGWGEIETTRLDGSVFVHFSMIRDMEGPRNLAEGQRVWFSWEPVAQDGCPYRAIDVFTSKERKAVPPAGQEAEQAYSSSLTIQFDDRTRSRR